MTRGTVFLLMPKDAVYSTSEFNGDMYPGGHYEDMVKRLKNVKDLKSFKKEMDDFNQKNFSYPEKIVQKSEAGYHMKSNVINWTDEDYFKDFKWFSDYLFFLNLTGDDVTICGHVLKNGEVGTSNFGADLTLEPSRK